ncbi:MAG: tetratricopeptide repeat protein [Verrucomicrobiota bacterium]|nr:tetratricopeptide repeat protein [Verrucomicrobiota bacterium]
MKLHSSIPSTWKTVLTCAGCCLLLAACSKPTPEKDIQKGLELLRKGELSAGRAQLEAALAQAPEAPFAAEINNWLGLAALKLGQPEAALTYFETAMKRNPAAFEPVYNAGCAALDMGDHSRGIRWLSQAAEMDANDALAMLRIGDWTTRHGRLDLAKRMYFAVQKRDARNAAAVTGLGRIALLEGQPAQAETYFMEALELNKDYPPALYNLGVLQSRAEGNPAQAMEYFRQYLAVAPNGERAEAAAARIGGATIEQTSFSAQVPARPKADVGILWGAVQSALQQGDQEAAYMNALRALELAREGGNAQQRGEILSRVMDVFGDRAAVQLEAGDHWMAQGNPKAAQAALMHAQALEPQNPMVLLRLARASAALEEYDTAVISLRQLARLEPGNADALWELAETYGERLGMTSRGISAYRDFEKRFPADPRAAEIPARVRTLEEMAAEWAPQE